MKMNPISFVLLFILFVLPLHASAQESSGQFTGGSVIIGYDNRACGSALTGAMRYNSSGPSVEYCDGSNWTNAGGNSFLVFNDLIDQVPSTLVTSIILQVQVSGSKSISISGDGSPEYRICSNDACGAEIQTWGSTPGTINTGEFLQLRLTSNASLNTMNSATVTIGPFSDQWDVTTGDDPCTASPSPGDVCADGSVYAGLSPDGNVAMFTTPADESAGFAWNNGNSSGYALTSQNSAITGETNTANLIGIDSDTGVGGTQPHLAAQQCANSTANSQNDWYLPAKNELNVLYTNKVAIGGFNTSGTYPAGYYWSSSENGSSGAWDQRFNAGSQGTGSKDFVLSVRCVRR